MAAGTDDIDQMCTAELDPRREPAGAQPRRALTQNSSDP